jgi:hypothetical protein
MGLIFGRVVMSRIKALVLGVALVSVGSPAIACYDVHEKSESYEQDNPYEQESPSSYGGLAGLSTPDESDAQRPVLFDLLIGFGAVVFTGSVGLLAKQVKSRG